MQPKITAYFPIPSTSSPSDHVGFIGLEFIARAQAALSEFRRESSTGVKFFPQTSSSLPLLRKIHPSEISSLSQLMKNLENIPVPSEYVISFPATVQLSSVFPDCDADAATIILNLEIQKLIKYQMDLASQALKFSVGLSEPLESSDSDFFHKFLRSSEVGLCRANLFSFSENPLFFYQRKRPCPEPASPSNPMMILRNSIIKMRVQKKKTYREIAEELGCTVGKVQYTLKRFKSFGGRLPTCVRPVPPLQKLNAEVLGRLNQFVESQRGLITGRRARAFLQEECGIAMSLPAVYYSLKTRLALRHKKCGRALHYKSSTTSKLSRFLVAQKFLSLIHAQRVPVCVDEFGLSESDLPKHCWVPASSPAARLRGISNARVNVIIAFTPHGILAAEAHTLSTSQITFLFFLNRLLSKLKELSQAQNSQYFVLLDNARIHRTPYIFSLIAHYKIPVLFNAPYSCPLNPVELIIGYLKERVRLHIHNTRYA